MIDSKSDKTKQELDGDVAGAKSSGPSSSRIATGAKRKKSSLAINIGQKKPAKPTQAGSRINLDKSSAPEPKVADTSTVAKKKNKSSLTITSKIRPKAKAKAKAEDEQVEQDKRVPVPPIVQKEKKSEEPVIVEGAARPVVPPLAVKSSEPASQKDSAIKQRGVSVPPPTSTLGKKLIEAAAETAGGAAKSVPPPPLAAKPPEPPIKQTQAEKTKVDTEAKPSIKRIADEPESLLSLLEPDPEEVTKLKQGPKQDRFLSQSVVLEESGLATLVRSSILLVAFLITVFFIWASFTTIDEVASTTGQVVPNTATQMIQHLEGGIIEEIYVAEGQIVKKGGPLFRLSPNAALGDLKQMRARLASLMAQKARIVAMIEEKKADFSGIPKEYSVIIQGQIKLLSAQRQSFTSQIDVYNTKIDRAQANLENLLAQQEGLQQQISYSEEEMKVKKIGYKKGLMSRLMVIAAKRDKIRAESELVRVIGSTVGARKDLHEAFNELNRLIDGNKEENLRELGIVTAELSQVSEGIARLEDRVARLEIFSPVWGIIKDLKPSTIGGVIAPGSVLTEIIPLDATRRVETMISTKDIGHVRVGQGVTVKVSTFDFARYGGIEGVLETISANTFDDPSGGEPFYKGLVRLEKSYIGNDPKSNHILPGMSVQADIHTGSKTIMEYLLKPIFASVNQSFRER
ncbi:MAG: HlyD family type I secretion periplasmic adaptor subunit [Magnetococcales bacterium]|nr:HlyD family type I secretion periplasmic adaptor subunit [Magnetococcales bacterium]